MQNDWLRRKLPALVAALLFLAFAALYLTGQRATSDALVGLWGIDPYRFPFLDTDTVLSAVRCFNAGVDAYLKNPCDDLQRVYTYSPLWMALLTPFPMDESWTAPIGLLVDLAFLATLFLLPAMRGWWMAMFVTLGAISTATVFAVERANNDLVLFTLAAGCAALLGRAPALRLAGYALALLAGLLKYYPLAVMAVALRERPGRFLAIAAASISLTAILAAAMWTELGKAFANIPEGSWWHDMYGSEVLGGGLSEFFSWSGTTETTIRAVLSLGALEIAIWLAFRPRTRAAVERLTPREWDFLLVGALLTLGCFFTAQNIGYRAVHLLLALPGLWVAAGAGGIRFRTAPFAALLLMWAMAWREYLTDAAGALLGEQAEPLAFFVLWLLREGLWWWTVTILLSLVVAFALQAPIVRAIVPARFLPAEGNFAR